MSTHSVTELLQQLQAGDSIAASRIWQRYITRLVIRARQRLKGTPRRAFDEDDVAITAFDAFLRGVADGRFKQLDNREDLWQVLVMLVGRQAIAFMRQELAEKRGTGKTRGESAFDDMDRAGSTPPGLDQFVDPDPAAVDQFTQSVRELLEVLSDDLLRQIAIAKLEGYSNQEIAQRLGISLRGVERKLQLIRQKWESEIDS
jgi:DNA-directed RNA polymerase specialized sigma24 family protein